MWSVASIWNLIIGIAGVLSLGFILVAHHRRPNPLHYSLAIPVLFTTLVHFGSVYLTISGGDAHLAIPYLRVSVVLLLQSVGVWALIVKGRWPCE